MSKPSKWQRAARVLGDIFDLVFLLTGFALLLHAAVQWKVATFERTLNFCVGAFLVTYPMLERRLREIDKTLMMLVGFVGADKARAFLQEYAQLREKHGTETGNGAEPAEKDNATTGAKG